MNPSSWKKSKEPVFKQSPENGVYGPGHNSFLKSPDGKEDYILYHARKVLVSPPKSGETRSPRMQKFTWKVSDYPDFGIPCSASMILPKPSGTKK